MNIMKKVLDIMQVMIRVRISKFKNIFAKGYTTNWSREIFIVNTLRTEDENSRQADIRKLRMTNIFV